MADPIWFVMVRFVAVYPCVFWCVYVVPLWKKLNDHPLPLEIPHRDKIYLSIHIQAILAISTAIWVLPSAALISSTKTKERGNRFTFISLMDICIVGGIIASLALQHSYLPLVSKSCHNAQNWQLVQPVVGNGTNLFWEIEFANGCKEKAEGCSPRSTCTRFVSAQSVSIVVLVTFLLVIYIPLMRIHIPWPLVHLYSYINGILKVARSKLKPSAAHRKNTRPQAIEMQTQKLAGPGTLSALLVSDEKSKIIVSISQNLHYVDIVSLSLTSKTLHQAVFSSSRTSRATRSRLIKMAACESGTKSECWCCNIEICKDCKHEVSLQEPSTKTHLDNCEPYCSSCYHKTYGGPLVSKQKKKAAGNYCPCVQARGISNNVYGYYAFSAYHGNAMRDICSICVKLSPAEMIGIRESREKDEIRHLLRQQLRCVGCTKVLKRGGLRWWGCSLCKKECVSDCHSTWEAGS